MQEFAQGFTGSFTEKLWSYKDSYLVFGSKKNKLHDLVSSYDGPIYYYDLDFIKERYHFLTQNLNCQVHYAMKANFNNNILKCLAELGSGLDVVSLGEIRQGIDCGFKPKDIIFSGVGKTNKEISEAIDIKIKQFNVESFPELKRIGKMASGKFAKVPVALRLNPDVDINTHPYIATGLMENKFGIELDQLDEICVYIKQTSAIELVGLSMHLGSQMLELTGFAEGLSKLVEVYKKLQLHFPYLKRIDVGGGLGIYYDRQCLNIERNLYKTYADMIKKETSKINCILQTEPGRWLVGHAGVLIAQVQYVKKNKDKTFVIIDSGMNHLIRPTLYDAYHEITPLIIKSEEKIVCDVVGPICETGDFFAKNREIPIVAEGDFVAIMDVGAYGYSMASDYNLQAKPLEKFL